MATLRHLNQHTSRAQHFLMELQTKTEKTRPGFGLRPTQHSATMDSLYP